MIRISSLAWVLLGLCLSRPGLAAEPTSIPRATTPQVHQAVDHAIKYLQTECAAWLNTRQCAACHHVPMPLWALGEAERQGYVIDKKFLAETVESLLGSKDKLLASRIFPDPAAPPDPRPQGRGLNMGLPFLAVAAQSLPAMSEGQKQSLKLIAEEIVQKQQPDGSWEFFATLRRPPINESQTTDAAWIIMALSGQTGPDSPKSQREALAKAITWLDAAKRSDLHQDKVLKVLMGVRSGKPPKTLQPTIDELLALQRADGGWSQTVPELKSDAFATGQTLYALSLAGFTADRPEIKRGIDFLVATQKPDGAWPMISRSTPNGDPGGAKLLTPITCAASSWATLGLARLVPKEKLDELAKDPALFLNTARKALKWDEPAEPAKLFGPVHFVGTKGLGSYLITGSEGHVLIFTGMPGSGEIIEKSIIKLGFKPSDVKIILTGHAHCDHVGGHVYLKKATGAKIAMMREEVELFQSGGKLDFHYGDSKEFAFDAAKADTIFRDEDEIKLGDITIKALLTPGHTKGSTTYVTKIVVDGKICTVVFPDGTSVNPGYRVTNRPSYKGIEDDFRRTFRTLEGLKPDIWLHGHTNNIGYDAKLAKAAKEGAAAWVDPEGYQKFVAAAKEKFEAAVEKEKKAP
ncbi:subclass B3 metallo-beta-lactamase [Zavarzinella formosa]|uniref:subclass B3 metallo-beta-lactamase n=1 Tax=Zavarzinella formosa TaxID=360055 RepID=UPI000308C526|nr:subclass B3 metallo-beta-lactamase [Zavarzinella formosa]